MIHLPFCSRTIQKHWKFDIESEFVGKQKLESLNSKAKLTSNETKEDLRAVKWKQTRNFVDLEFSAFKQPTTCPDGSKNLHW